MKLKGITAVVTGGASGLGSAAVREFAAAGARVAVLDRNGEGASSLAKETGGLGIACDVTDTASVAAALKQVRATLGAPRLLLNAAGIGYGKRTASRKGMHDLDAFRTVIEVNLIGTFDLCRQVGHDMIGLEPIGEERGVIINVSSIFGTDGPIGNTAYAASKAAVAGMTLPMARDFGPYGIRVMAIAPGIFETPLAKAEVGEAYERLLADVPFPTRAGHPAEFALLARQIAENTMLNGETIRIDGAFRMGLRI